MTIFSLGVMLNYQSLNELKEIENSYQIEVRQPHLKHDYTKVQVEIQIVFRCALHYQNVQISATFTEGIMGRFS